MRFPLPCHTALMLALASGMMLCPVGSANAFDLVPAERLGTRGFSLGGARADIVAPGFRVMPYAGSGTEPTLRQRVWNDAAQFAVGERANLAVGSTSHFERRFNAVRDPSDRFSEVFAVPQSGAFVSFRDNGLELGRFAVTTGVIAGTPRGFDIAATRSFGLADGVSVNFGPTLSFGEAERFGFASQAWSGTRLAATGATLGFERALTTQTTASLSASYALIHALPNQVATPQGGRNRFDIGLTLSTKLLGN
jgi:hypothetical protein